MGVHPFGKDFLRSARHHKNIHGIIELVRLDVSFNFLNHFGSELICLMQSIQFKMGNSSDLLGIYMKLIKQMNTKGLFV